MPSLPHPKEGVSYIWLPTQVQPNPVLQGVVAVGADALPTSLIQDVFAGQCGNIVNFGLFGQALKRLDRWYQDRGVFGQVNQSATCLGYLLFLIMIVITEAAT